MNKLRLFTGFLILLYVFGQVTNVGAASNITIAKLQVDIWPEFDRPNVLVIYHITVSPETTFRMLPRTVMSNTTIGTAFWRQS